VGEILVLAESKEGSLEKPTLELIHAAKGIASDLGVGSATLLLGNSITELSNEIAGYGLDKVYKLENSLFKDFIGDVWVAAIEQVCKNLNPDAVLISHSDIGREIAPRLAYRLNSIATTDCISLSVNQDDKTIIKNKPIYGGNAIAVLKSLKQPEIITLRKNCFPLAEASSEKSEIVELPVEISQDVVKVEIHERKHVDTVELDKAEVIISGGRGIASDEDFKMLEQLADLIKKAGANAMVGCSRPIVDMGWMSSDHQVGLTGTMVAPGIYLAIGISGAIQHLVGMVRSKKIIAINTDPGCNMLKVADYGLVDDYTEIIPHLIKKMEELS